MICELMCICATIIAVVAAITSVAGRPEHDHRDV
jgi:hypothetical protein